MDVLKHNLRLPKNVAQQFILDIMGMPSNLECGLLDAEEEEAVLCSTTQKFGTKESLIVLAKMQFLCL